MGPAIFMYFWLNDCDENHIKRIPIPVKNIGHLSKFRLIGFICFCFLTVLELMIMNI